MFNNGITFYKTDPVFSKESYKTHAVGKSGRFSNDIKKTIGLKGTEIDNNFLCLEGRDIYNFYIDEEKNLVIQTLNGDKYRIKVSEFSGQSDWDINDIGSISYIKNKPTKLSSFTNDKAYTSTSYTQIAADDKNSYEIGIITIDGNSIKIYGKIIGGSPVITTDVEYIKELSQYVINITNDMFTNGYETNYLVRQLYGDKGSYDAYIFYDESVHINVLNYDDGITGPIFAGVSTPGHPENKFFLKYNTKNCMYITCFVDENGERHAIFTVLSDLKVETPIAYKIEINNSAKDTVISVTPTLSSEMPHVEIYSDGNIDMYFSPSKTAYFNALSENEKKPIQCNWTLVSDKGETTKFENKDNIQVSVTGNYKLYCENL